MELYLNVTPEESVLEVHNAMDLSGLNYCRDKFVLPSLDSDKQRSYFFFTLNTSISSIVSLLTNKYSFIQNKSNSYNAYYYNHKLLRNCLRIRNVTVPGVSLADAKTARLVRYNRISSEMNGIQTPIQLDILHGKNFVYDLEPLIELMSNEPRMKKQSLSSKIQVYFNTLKNFILQDLNSQREYTRGPVFINLDDKTAYTDVDHYHFLTYLIMLFRKNQSFMDEFVAPYKVILYTSRGYLVFDMSKDLLKNNLSKLKFAINRLKPSTNLMDIESLVVKDEIASKLNQVNGFTGDTQLEPEDEVVDKIAKSDTFSDETVDPKDAVEAIPDEELAFDEMDDITKKDYYNNILTKKTGYEMKELSPRDKMLREKQASIKMKNSTIGELVKDIDPPAIEEDIVHPPGALRVIDDNVTTIRFPKFEETYNNTLLEKHLAEVFTSFNNKSINASIVDIKVKDTSDNLTMKEQYTVVFEDEARRRHTMNFNVPKFIDDKFLYVNGNKRVIQKQFMGMPVIKTDTDTVQICTNYNKIFIRRQGAKFNPNMEKLRKYITNPMNNVTIVRGLNLKENKEYLTCLEYDQLSETYTSIEIGSCKFIFNMKMLEEELGGKYKSEGSKILIGIRRKGTIKEPLYYDTNNAEHIDLAATMIQEASPGDYDSFKKLSFGKKYVYTKATILTKQIPVVLVILFFEGMTEVLKKFDDPNVTFVDKKSNQDNNMYIPFSDGYLTYPMSDIEACIMFNGLLDLPTALYSIAEMDDRETYISFFEYLFGSGYIAGGLLNYYDFMIDPITLKIIKMLNYPEDIVSLIIYANNLLADNNYKSDLNLSMYRLRDNEIVPALVYYEMTKAYSRYRKTFHNNNPVKMSVDPDCVFKALNELPSVESYSRLSPVTEVKTNSIASMKGYVGMNMDRAYKQDKRVFDDSMLGIVGLSTDISGNCGKERHLVLEPNIINAYGMMKVGNRKDISELKDVNLETPVEMICPGGLRHDDPVRTAMASKQSCHAIPIKDQSPLLVSNGFDSTIHYRTCDDFSVVAKEDGEVVELDQKTQIMVVKYKSGKVKAIDLSSYMAKNGGGGIYLENKLDTSFKVGDKFKKDAILAFDKSFYKDTGVFGNRLTFGTLLKSAIMSDPSTYEDSTFITKRASEKMSADIVKMKTFVIKKNSSVDYMIKKGDTVRIGDDLIRFDTSYDEDELNKLLSNVRDDLQEEIINMGKTNITSKYAGIIKDVVVYPTVPLDEMTPSLAKVVKNIQDDIKRKKKLLDKYDPDSNGAVYRMGILLDKPDDVVKPDRYGKIKGQDVEDGVMFEVYISYHDEMSDGDKVTHMTANKATVGLVVPKGMEPYTAFRPYEEISVPIAPSAVLQRGTPSIKPTMCYYKCLIELKRAWYEILTGESWNEKQKRENTYMLKPETIQESTISTKNIITASMEVVFDLAKNEKGEYYSTMPHATGDVILPIEENTFEDNIYLSDIKVLFSNDELQPNVRYNGELGIIESICPIYPGELLVIE